MLYVNCQIIFHILSTNTLFHAIITLLERKVKNMNTKTLEKLEFHKIREIVSDFAITYIGKNLAQNLMPMENKKEIEKALHQSTEALTLLYRLGNPPISEIADITISLKQLENANSLTLRQLLELCHILQISQNLKHYLDTTVIEISDFSNLTNLFENLYSNPGIVKSIQSAIIDENTMDDNASPELKNIRNQIRKKEQEIHTKLHSLLHSKYVQEPIVTIRNGRFVIPVKSEYRQEVKGFVHDTSTSGSSLFIEPIAIFDINNEISHLRHNETLEIEKILMKLSSLFFEHIDDLSNTTNLIGLLDFIFAKAKFSKEFECTEPIINQEKMISLVDCYHPLISRENAVKNTIELGKDFTSLIITGPNTGGKTVVLKTVGLLVLMGMSGLPIPAKSGSSIFLFDNIFADIGDEQSISDSLSTFSSHMTNIAFLLKQATSNSLVLVDELGSGTDPIEGSSLAISILEHLNQANILTIATTHYHEIKNFALVTDGFENASVEFNLDTLSPTYKLLIGVPGRSNAFIISEKLEISKEIIERAKDFINEDTTNVEELLNNIHKDYTIIEEEKRKIEVNSSQIEALKNSYETNAENLKKKEAEILENAKIKAREILLSAKEDANDILRELEKSTNAKQGNQLRKKLNQKIDDLSIAKSSEEKPVSIDQKDIKIGLTVEIPHLNQVGTVLSEVTKNDTVQVQIGSIKTYFKISELVVSKKAVKNDTISSRSKHEFRPAQISPEINVIGQNVEDACFMVDKYLDNCALNGLATVRIVHGKGTGILKKGIQQFLKKHPHVKSYRLGTFGEGEDGVTVVELKE